MQEEDQNHPLGSVLKSQTPAITVMALVQAEGCLVQDTASRIPPEMQ